MIVDDSQPMRELLKLTLAGVAEVVGECSDGRDLDGIAATRQILAADPPARVVIVTNHDNEDLRRAARQAGAVRYIVKEDLVDILSVLPTE